MLKQAWLNVFIALCLAVLILKSNPVAAEQTPIPIPGGGTVTAPDGFHFDDHTPELLRPDDLVVLVRDHRTTIGGYAKFNAAITIAHRSRIASPKALVQASGPFLRDHEWRAAVEEHAGPFDPVGDRIIVAKTFFPRKGLWREWQEPAWIVAGLTADKSHAAAVFVRDKHFDKHEALDLLDRVLQSIAPGGLD